MKEFNYYRAQLDKLKDFTTISVSMVDFEGNKTKSMGLNQDSIPEIISFLNDYMVYLESEEKKISQGL
jgi:hypothetical protein